MSDLEIIGRNKWDARPPRCRMEKRPASSINQVFFHWPGSNPESWKHVRIADDRRATMRAIQNFHMDANRWCDMGYNHVIVPDYRAPTLHAHVYEGRGWEFTPAAQANHNTGTLACLILMGPEDVLHESTKRRMRSYVRWAKELTGNDLRVRPHKAVTATACPGPKLFVFIAREWGD